MIDIFLFFNNNACILFTLAGTAVTKMLQTGRPHSWTCAVADNENDSSLAHYSRLDLQKK